MSEVIYTDKRQRTHALHLGLWLFLGSETLLFAGLFGLYAAYRTSYPFEFRAGIKEANVAIGTSNTAVLLISSFFVAWAVHSVRADRRRRGVAALGVAFVLGALFLFLKSVEYAEHIHRGLGTGAARLFVTLYFLMTGLHALHVIAGMTILGWIAVRVHRGTTHAGHHTELDLGGLYWHLVDIFWIFLWPLLYLTHQ